jgi:ABC-type branched-subunit amino acid transport system ATPase component/ABC-type branched-subunit amino acid transport system permease subunit
MTGTPARIAVAVLLVVVVLAAPQFAGNYYVHIMVLMLIAAVFAMSLDLLMGYAGLPSLGHAAFFGVGAYAAGLVTARYGGGWVEGVAAGILATLVLAAAFGVVALRVRDLYFLLITLALAQVLWGAANRWGSFTGGYNGLRGIPKYLEIGGSALGAYYAILPIAVLLGLAMYLIVRSPFGLSLQGVRDSESRMFALGYNVWLHKYLVFVLSGTFAGTAGIISAFYKGFVSPFDLSLSVSAEAILMVILGGTGTLIGPILGAVIIVALRNMLSVFVSHWLILLGAIFVATVFVAPNGVIGWFSGSRRENEATTGEDDTAEAGDDEANAAIPAAKGAVASRPAQDGAIVLGVERLSKAFGGMMAVRDVGFEVRQGERVAILGPNGAGKSSLFNLVSGHLPATSGTVRLFGVDVSRMAADKRARAGLGRTFQITNLFHSLSVADNLRIALASAFRHRLAMHRFASGYPELEADAERLLADAGLQRVRGRRVRDLAYGEQRQLEFAMALALRPKLLLLDEPTAGLSASESRTIVGLVHGLDPSLTVLIIEHDLDVALAVADRVIVFHLGEKVADGTPEQIRDNPLVREIYLGGFEMAS